LQAAAQTCLNNIREVDLLGRFSDNMLVVLLPETKDLGAELVANRLVEKIAARSVDTTLGSLKPLVERSIVTNMQMEVNDINEMIRFALEKYSPQKVSADSVIVAESELKYK
jgi:GGDEF domain-containing protein